MGCSLIVATRALTATPDLILFNGDVFTSDPARLRAEAIAIRGERIVAVGANEAIQRLAERKTESSDLGGRVVIPGFNDAHYHFMPKFTAHRLALSFPEPSWEEVIAAVADAVKQATPGTLIYGEVGGLVVTEPDANRTALDRIAPLHPVLLSAWFGHGQIFNSGALRRLGIADDEPDPLGGWFEREAGSRRINGKVFEYAADPALRRLADSVPDADVIQGLRDLSEEALLELALATRAGMTTEESAKAIVDWLATARHPQSGRPSVVSCPIWWSPPCAMTAVLLQGGA